MMMGYVRIENNHRGLMKYICIQYYNTKSNHLSIFEVLETAIQVLLNKLHRGREFKPWSLIVKDLCTCLIEFISPT